MVQQWIDIWLTISSRLIPCLQLVPFGNVLVNLILLRSKYFVAYGTTVTFFGNFEKPCAKGSHLMQNPISNIKRVYLPPTFSIKFSLIYDDFKNKCLKRNTFFLLHTGYLSFEIFISSAVSNIMTNNKY